MPLKSSGLMFEDGSGRLAPCSTVVRGSARARSKSWTVSDKRSQARA
jgi:hypothetical protein